MKSIIRKFLSLSLAVVLAGGSAQRPSRLTRSAHDLAELKRRGSRPHRTQRRYVLEQYVF